jgi:hypothetical protein
MTPYRWEMRMRTDAENLGNGSPEQAPRVPPAR